MTAAHRTLPFGTVVKVTNLTANCAAVVRINDRGPYKKGRIIDVSKAAAKQLKMIGAGTASVQVEVIGLAGR
jgi:rare lipoprotein A